MAVSLVLASATVDATARPSTDVVSSKSKRPNAIIGGDTQAIIGGDRNAIIGGDRNAIIGGDRNAIIGGDRNAIIGGDTQAIIGGDLQKSKRPNAIIGGDRNAIIGGDRNAIIGGDRNAIIGGDRNAIIGGDVLAGVAKGAVLQGPIEKVDVESGRLTVLGKSFSAGPRGPALAQLADQIASGASVTGAILGSLDDRSRVRVNGLVVLPTQYVAGHSKVMVIGKVSELRNSIGLAVVDGIAVDYTALLSQAHIDLKPGDLVMALGVQAAAGAPLQAAAFTKIEKAR